MSFVEKFPFFSPIPIRDAHSFHIYMLFLPNQGRKTPVGFDPEISEPLLRRLRAPPLSSRLFHHRTAKKQITTQKTV